MLQLNLVVLTPIGQIPENEVVFMFCMYNYWHYEHYVVDCETWFIQKSGNGDCSNNSKIKPTGEIKRPKRRGKHFVVCSWLSLAIPVFLLIPSFSKYPHIYLTEQKEDKGPQAIWLFSA